MSVRVGSASTAPVVDLQAVPERDKQTRIEVRGAWSIMNAEHRDY